MTDNLSFNKLTINDELKENDQYKICQIKSIFYITTLVLKNIYSIRRDEEKQKGSDLQPFQSLDTLTKNNWSLNDTLKFILNITPVIFLSKQVDEKIKKENKIIDKIDIIFKHVFLNDNIDISTFNKDNEMLLDCIEQINQINNSNNNNNEIIYTKEKINLILNTLNFGGDENLDNKIKYEKKEEIDKILQDADTLYKDGQFKKSYQLYDSLKCYQIDDESCSFYTKYCYCLGIGKSGLQLYLATKINSYITMDHRKQLDDYIKSVEESLVNCPLSAEPHYILAQLLLKKSNSNYKTAIQHLQIAIILEPTNNKQQYQEYLDQIIIEKTEIDENMQDSDSGKEPDFEKWAHVYLEKNRFKDWFTGVPLQSIDDKRDGGQLFLDNENEMAMQWFKNENNKSLFSFCYLGKLLSSGKKGIDLDYKASISLLLEGSLMVPKNEFEMSELSKIRLELAHRFIHGVNGVGAADIPRTLYYLRLVSKDDPINHPSCFYLTALAFMDSYNESNPIPSSYFEQLINPILSTGIKLGCKKSLSLLNKLNEKQKKK